jgi:hypothetical protein
VAGRAQCQCGNEGGLHEENGISSDCAVPGAVG